MNLFTPYPHPTYKTKQTTGFTIVELLIVIVVIAVLAAISIVAYNGIQSRATEAVIKSDFSNFMKAAELYSVNEGVYPGGATTLKAAGVVLTKSAYDAAIVCTTSDRSLVGLVADAKNGNSYYISNMQPSISLYTDGKVQGRSGGVTCPNIGISGWHWLLQVSNGTWTI